MRRFGLLAVAAECRANAFFGSCPLFGKVGLAKLQRPVLGDENDFCILGERGLRFSKDLACQSLESIA